MENYQIILDAIMCLLWITTYTLCFVSTIRFKHHSLSPFTVLLIAPFEFAVIVFFVKKSVIGFNYASITYIYWSLIEIGLCILLIKYTFKYETKKVITYLIAMVGMTSLMFYLVVVKEEMLFYSYFNTFLGEVFWFFYILKDDYPIKPLNLAAFTTKLVADTIAVPIYINAGDIKASVLCVLLPILDFCFIVVFFIKLKKNLKICERSF